MVKEMAGSSPHPSPPCQGSPGQPGLLPYTSSRTPKLPLCPRAATGNVRGKPQPAKHFCRHQAALTKATRGEKPASQEAFTFCLLFSRRVASIQLQHVHTPLCKGLGILFHKVQCGAWVAPTGEGAQVAVNAQLQASGMDLRGEESCKDGDEGSSVSSQPSCRGGMGTQRTPPPQRELT